MGTGGGAPPTSPHFTEDMALAASIMGADLEMGEEAVEIGVPAVSPAVGIPPGNT